MDADAQLQAEIRRKLQADVERHLHEQLAATRRQLPVQQVQQQAQHPGTASRRSSSVDDIGRDEPPTPRTGRRHSAIRGSSIHTSAFSTAASDNSVRDACRFHDGTHRHKRPVGSEAASSPGTSVEAKAAAGAAKAMTKYVDMPPDTHGSRGRARSMTPDYYQRYSSNVIGTSLPGADGCSGSSVAERTPCQRGPSPRSSSAGRRAVAQGPATPCRKTRVECRFHYDSEPRTRVDSWNRPFTVSSTEARPTAAFAGSLRGNGSCPRLPPQSRRGWVF